MIALFTDFGWRGPYVGQVHAVLARHAGTPTVIDLMHDAPAFRPVAAGHLLAALSGGMPAGTVFIGVVDPGVGTDRQSVAVQADEQWYVGPANGLFDVVSARAGNVEWWRITREPDGPASTFHGRDLFAPVAATLAREQPVPGERIDVPVDGNAGEDLAEVIYVDDYGNAMTGLRVAGDERRPLRIGTRHLARGRTFADAAEGEPLWLVNSIGLVEIAANRASAAELLGLEIGTPVTLQGGIATG